MIIWAALLVPVFTAFVLWRWWEHKTAWWEFFAPFGCSFLFVLCAKLVVDSYQTSDTEYWTGWITHAEYYEDWNERVPCSHPRYDSKGNFEGYQHLYDVDYHPPYWVAHDNNGLTLHISQSEYKRLVNKFGNSKFVDLGRWYHTNDGDKYVTTFKGTWEDCEVCCTSHRYENRILGSKSVFNFVAPADEEKRQHGLFDYPKITGYWDQPSVLGWDDRQLDRKLSIWNAKLGKSKQVKIFLLVFKDKSLDAAFKQADYWQGGNKNELIVCVGLKGDSTVDWAHVISWTDVETLKVDVRNHILHQPKLDLSEVVDWVGNEVDQRWQRKQFEDFDYLTVEPPWWVVLLVFLLTIGVNVGVSAVVIHNEVDH